METIPQPSHPADDNDRHRQVVHSAEAVGGEISDQSSVCKSMSVPSIVSGVVSKARAWSRRPILLSISDAVGVDACIQAQEQICFDGVEALKDACSGQRMPKQSPCMEVALVACRPIIGAVIATALVSVSFTSIRMENPITDPHRWGGCLILCITFWTLTLSMFSSMLFNAVFTGTYKQLVLRAILGSFLFASVVTGTLWVGLWVLVVHVWNLAYPLPFHGTVAGQTATFCLTGWLWLDLLSAWRQDRRFRYRIILFQALWLVFLLTFGAHLMFAAAVLHAPFEYQWALATIGFFLLREISLRTSAFCVLRASAQDVRATLLANAYIEMLHLMILCTFLGSGTNWSTTIALLSTDLVRGVRAGTCAASLLARVPRQELSGTDAIKAATALLGEELELLVPLAFFCCRFVISQGGNAQTVGNAAEQWQHEPVNDWGRVLSGTLMLVSVDALSFLITRVYAWLKAFPLSYWQLHMVVHEKYGNYLMAMLAYQMVSMFCLSVLECGVGLTFAFEWLHKA